MQRFSAQIEIIGVNPYVLVPGEVLNHLQKEAKKDKGPLPVKGELNGKPFIQTIVKYQGLWRLYLNTPMREATNTQVGDAVTVAVEIDPDDRIIEVPILLKRALSKNKLAQKAFEALPPYRQKEISRYIGNLKSEETIKKNVEKVIQHLKGENVQGVLFYERKKT